MARVPSVAQTEQTFRPLSAVARMLAVTGRCCADCGSPEIRPSNRRNAVDVMLACLFLAPFRCRVCRGRFYRVWRPSLQRPPDSEPPAAPLLMTPPRRTFLNLEATERRRIEPQPMHPSNHDPQLIPVPHPEIEIRGGDVIDVKPAKDAAPVETSQPIPATPGPILILETDLSIRKLLRRLLERRGYLTLEMSQAADLAGALRDRRADLLIVDVSAVPETGVAGLVALAHAYPKLKILVLSAESLQGSEIPGRLLALPKPFALDRFVDCVDRLLERPGQPKAM
jgi:CheY-like chemotaxis protein